MHDAIPVLVDVRDPTRTRLRNWLEGTLGWQVVEEHGSAGIPPVCALVGASAEARDRTVPTVLVVNEDDDPVAAVRAAVRLEPVGVLRWPDDRDRLPAVIERALVSAMTASSAIEELRVAGAAGGVGTTTVALGLAGLLAWGGNAVLAVNRGPVPLDGVRVLSTDDLAGSGTWRAAVPTPGCEGLRVVGCAEAFEAATIDAGPATALVRDLGSADAPDVLVLRRDRAGLEALEATTASVAVVTDDGVVPSRALRAAAGHRRLVTLPRSARVARAVAGRRVPASLPGTWLRSLAAVFGGRPQR